MLNSIGTKHNLCHKYYTTSDGRLTETLRALLSSHGFVHKPAAPQFDRLVRNGTLVYEFPTLHRLWLHCKDSPTESVIYMHTLGSHKSWSLRRHLTRRVLQGQVLHGGDEECVDLPGKWHCGPNPNFSRCWEHYSGNFWRASCSHVNSLQEPTLGEAGFVQAMQMGTGHGDSEKCAPIGPLGRYWAEAWIVHGVSDQSRKQQLIPIQSAGDASVFHRFVHQLFFRHRLNIVYLVDKVAYLVGVAKVESILGLPGHVVEHGGDAQRFLDALKTKPVDVLAGSPLCEGFSSLNAHSSGDASRLKRNHLKYWGQAVMKLQPEYAVMENVPEVMSPKHKQNLSTLLLQLAGCGYQLQCYVLSSWAFGAGSDRERFVLLATRLGTPLPPNLQPFHAKKNVHQHDRGVRWAFASKRAWTGADSREKARLPRCVTLADVLETLGPPDVPPRRAHVAGNLHSARIESVRVQSLMDGVPTTLNACYATIPKSIRAANAVPRYEKNLTTTGKLGYRRMQSNSPARSPTKKSSPDGMQGCVMHPTESRVCTPAENLCAMGFAYERLPDAKLSVGHAMAGNAFSPLVAKALFDAMAVSRSRKRRRHQGSDIEGGRNHDGSLQLRPWEKAARRARAER